MSESLPPGQSLRSTRRQLLTRIFVPIAIVCAVLCMGPLFGRHREPTKRAICTSHLQRFGQAMVIYANQNHNMFPSDFDALARHARFEADIYVCPSGNSSAPIGGANQPILDHVPSTCNYIYLGGGLAADVPGDVVLMTEPLQNHRQGLHVLLSTNRVEFVSESEAEKVLEQINSGVLPVRLRR